LKKTWITAAAVLSILVCAALLFFAEHSKKQVLILYRADTREEIARWNAPEGTRFAVEFIHSVNKSPVRDVYEIQSGNIVAVETRYSSFGAGVQTELLEGQTLTYDNGVMVVSGFDLTFDSLRYIVGTVSDHVLFINEEQVGLRELCGKNAPVVFECRSVFI